MIFSTLIYLWPPHHCMCVLDNHPGRRRKPCMSLEMTHQLRISAGWREDTGLLIVSEISRYSFWKCWGMGEGQGREAWNGVRKVHRKDFMRQFLSRRKICGAVCRGYLLQLIYHWQPSSGLTYFWCVYSACVNGACTSVHECSCACTEAEEDCVRPALLPSILFSWDCFSYWTRSRLWPVSPSHSPVSVPVYSAGVAGTCMASLTFGMGARIWTQVPMLAQQTPFIHEPSLHPSFSCYFGKIPMTPDTKFTTYMSTVQQHETWYVELESTSSNSEMLHLCSGNIHYEMRHLTSSHSWTLVICVRLSAFAHLEYFIQMTSS